VEPEYIDLNYEPEKSDFLAFAYLESVGKFEKACEQIAAESSVGTWTDLATMSEFAAKICAKVFKIKKTTPDEGFVWIAYPKELFDTKNLAQNLSILFGNLFELKFVKKIEILDIRFPKWFVKVHGGPKFEIRSIKREFDVGERPLLITTMKPKLGLNSKEIADIFEKALRGGVDLLKDEEILVDQEYCKFEERLEKVMEVIEKVESETGEKKAYLVNITGSYPDMVERIDDVCEFGNKAVMLNMLLLENDLRAIIDYAHKKNLLAFGHFVLQGAYSERISNYVLQKLARILGFDLIHLKSCIGKLREGILKSMYYKEALTSRHIPETLFLGILEQEIPLKPALPVIWGGTHPGQIEAIRDVYGFEIAIQAGGSIHGHPLGSYGGARAWRESFDACLSGIPVEKYEGMYLRKAIEKWGTVKMDAGKARKRLENMLPTLNFLVLENGIKYSEFIDNLFLSLASDKK